MHPFGWLSILPPVVAIGLAILTRRVVVSLFVGLLAGGLILSGGHPWQALVATLQDHLWATLILPEKLHVFFFTILMGAMVGIINRSGGMLGLVDVVSPWARNDRRGQFTAWMLGLFVFFDDYANTMLLGNTLRPLTDRLKISREKLAYLVDCTAAPVSGLAIVSTWVAGELGYVQDGLDKLPGHANWQAWSVFLQSIPYRFYVLWTLLFVPLIAWMGRDFGPMWAAERKARRADTNVPQGAAAERGATDPHPDVTARWYNAVIPIGVTVTVIVWIMYDTGRAAVATESPNLMEIFGNADAYGSLLWGALAGAVVAAALSRLQSILTVGEVTRSAASGAAMMCPALIILWFASTLSIMTGNKPSPADSQQQQLSRLAGSLAQQQVPPEVIRRSLKAGDFGTQAAQRALEPSSEPYPFRGYRLYTGEFLSAMLESRLPAPLLPTLIFALSAAVAFATGTSWGTMGIIMPLAIPLVYAVLTSSGISVAPDNTILLASVGGVLAGAIFGDHCSPISDTTVLSSQASGCDHMAHVWTQLPYALLVAAASMLFGTLPVGLGVPVWIVLPVGLVALAAYLRWFGKTVS